MHVNLGACDPLHQPQAQGIVYRGGIDQGRFAAEPGACGLMQACRVAFDDFADRVKNGFFFCVSRAKPVGTGQKDSIRRGVAAQITADKIAGHADRATADQVMALHPVDRNVWQLLGTVAKQGQIARIDRAATSQSFETGVFDVAQFSLGVKELYRLHRRRNPRLW